jgi:hypothetical protein
MALQQGVFNVTDPTWNVLPSNSPSLNTTKLQNLVTKLLSADGPTGGNGGTIQFPSVGTYQFSGAAIVIGPDDQSMPVTQPYSIIFEGTGQGSLAAPILVKTDGGDFFQVNNNAGEDSNVGGVTFRDLHIMYSTVQTSGAAIHVLNGQNVRVLRVILTDCPQAVYFEESLQCSMIDCTVIYPKIGTSSVTGTALTIGHPTNDNSAIETYVAGCVFRNVTNTGVGIQINNAEHLRVTNSRVEGFQQGIRITPGGTFHNVRKVHFGNVGCFPTSSSLTIGAAVLIQPTNGTWVAQVTFAECELDAPDGSTSYQGGGVVIDPVNGASGGGVIDQIRFVDCHVCKWPGPGLLILGGNSATAAASNIEVVGGYYSLNGGNPATGVPSAGIAVIGGTAGPSGLRITGAACNNTIYDVTGSGGGGGFLTAVQDYGISIATAQNVFARACDLRGNLTKPLTVSGTITNLQVSECAAYNDQATSLATSAPSGTFGGTTFGYYGPVAFYASGGTNVTVNIDGASTGLPSGGFTLAPGETAAFVLGVGGHLPTTFFIVGK